MGSGQLSMYACIYVEISGTELFIPKGFELSATLGAFIREKISRGVHNT